jgi:hypothetical protein
VKTIELLRVFGKPVMCLSFIAMVDSFFVRLQVIVAGGFVPAIILCSMCITVVIICWSFVRYHQADR